MKITLNKLKQAFTIIELIITVFLGFFFLAVGGAVVYAIIHIFTKA